MAAAVTDSGSTSGVAPVAPARLGPGGPVLSRLSKVVGREWPTLVAVVVALASLAVALGELVVERPVLHSYGDTAALELGVLEAQGGDRLLGPYSRFGWFHPGPAYFYLQAPLLRLFGQQTWAFYAGALVLNGASILALLGLARRWCGRLAPLLVACLVVGLILRHDAHLFLDVWNPHIVLLPLLCLCFLAAVAPRSSAATVAVVVLGSAMVQTHIGMAPIVVGLGVLVLTRRLEGSSRWRFGGGQVAWVGGTAALLALLWTGPVLDQARAEPGNLGLLARFVREGGASPTLVDSLTIVGRQLARLPLGLVDSAVVARSALAATVAVALVVAVVGSRRGHALARDLGVVGLVALATAVVAVGSITGPVEPYLVTWVSLLPAPVVVGAALLAGPRAQRAATGPLVVASLVLGLAATPRIASFPVERDWSVAEVAEVAALALDALARDSLEPGAEVAVEVTTGARQPIAAGVVLRLAREGFDVTVMDRLSVYYDRRDDTGREDAALLLADLAVSDIEGFDLLGSTGGTSVFLRPS